MSHLCSSVLIIARKLDVVSRANNIWLLADRCWQYYIEKFYSTTVYYPRSSWIKIRKNILQGTNGGSRSKIIEPETGYEIN